MHVCEWLIYGCILSVIPLCDFVFQSRCFIVQQFEKVDPLSFFNVYMGMCAGIHSKLGILCVYGLSTAPWEVLLVLGILGGSMLVCVYFLFLFHCESFL